MIIEFLARYGLRLLFVVGIVALVVGWLSNIYNGIYEKGVKAERVEWQQKEAQAAELRNKKIKELTEEVKEIERIYASKFAKIEADHKKEIENANAQKQRDVAAAKSGALKLRWTAKTESGTGGNTTGKSAGGACIGNGATQGELPREITANLYTLVNDADGNTEQLTACQDVLREFQKFRCNTYKETTP